MTRCPHCGSRPRSSDDHRRFFGLVKAAFEQWPESHEFQPDNPEHLRAWLLCRVNHRKSTVIETEEPASAVLVVEAAFRAAGAYAFVRPYGAGLAVHSPRSLSWDELDQKKFGPIRDEVSALIESIVGVSADQLLKEKAA